jgi:hypothetical protein
MCTIGSFFNQDYTISFKQCDLKKPTKFFTPEILNGLDGIRYTKFGREGNTGSWCGVNNFGVSFSAADSYLSSTAPKVNCNIPTKVVFDAYIKIISEHKTAKKAAAFMCEFYETFIEADIVIISDYKETYYIEAYNNKVICVKRSYSERVKDNHFICTNHFRYIHGAINYNDNHSTYLRLERAELLAGLENPNAFELLSDRYYGDSVYSICRNCEITPDGEEPYFTQASAVFATNGKTVNCAYLINGNPITEPFILISDIFGESIQSSSRDVYKLMENISDFDYSPQLLPL